MRMKCQPPLRRGRAPRGLPLGRSRERSFRRVRAQEPAPAKARSARAGERRGGPDRGHRHGEARPGETGPRSARTSSSSKTASPRRSSSSRPSPGLRAACRRAAPRLHSPGAEADDAEDLLPARYVVLVIDDLHLEFSSLARVRKALDRFLTDDLGPEDQVALVTTSGANASRRSSRPTARSFARPCPGCRCRTGLAGWTGVPYMSEYQAELIEGGDPLALEAAVQEIMAAGHLPGRGIGGGAGEDRRRACSSRRPSTPRGSPSRHWRAWPGPRRRVGPQGAVPGLGRLPHRHRQQAAAELRPEAHRRREHPGRGRHLLARHPRPRSRRRPRRALRA